MCDEDFPKYCPLVQHEQHDNKTKAQEKLRKSWIQILAILKEHGYDHLYQEDITRVANVVRKEIGLDKQ